MVSKEEAAMLVENRKIEIRKSWDTATREIARTINYELQKAADEIRNMSDGDKQ